MPQFRMLTKYFPQKIKKLNYDLNDCGNRQKRSLLGSPFNNPLDCESGKPSMKCEAVPHQIAQI